MKLALDSHYTIGKLHLCCEDYGCHGRTPLPHVILADGCSAAPDSDVGARLLVLNARRLLPQFMRRDLDTSGRQAQHWRLGRRVVRSAARQARDMGLHLAALDATLLVAWCDGVTVHVHLYGDGCILTRNRDGMLAAIQVEYAENMPYYLSYLLDRQRWALYQSAVGDARIAQRVRHLREGGDDGRLEAFDTPAVFSFPLAAFPTVAVATDGLHSLIEADTGARLDLLEVARSVLDFDSLDSDFVRRRLRKTLAEYGRRLVFNLDDLSLGVFAAAR